MHSSTACWFPSATTCLFVAEVMPSSVPPWRCHIGDLSRSVVVVVVNSWCCLCSACEEVHMVCVGETMQRAHGYWRSWAARLVVWWPWWWFGQRWVSHSDFRYLSPWQRSARRWVRRGPHEEWPGSMIFIGAATEVFCWCTTETGSSTIVCGLRVIVHDGVVRVAAQACSGSWHSAWHNVGNDDAVCGGTLSACLLNCGDVVSCWVRCLCGVFASAHYIQFLLFRIWCDSALPLLKKKQGGIPHVSTHSWHRVPSCREWIVSSVFPSLISFFSAVPFLLPPSGHLCRN
jgi:hypothetical protein